MRGRVGRSGAVRIAVVALAIAAIGGGIGLLAALGADVSDTLDLALLAALAVLALGLGVSSPPLIIALGLPASLLMARVGGFLSVADVALAGATVVALLTVRGTLLLPMRTLLWAGTAYLAAALPAVALHPYTANVVEWVHEVMLVLGSMVVGFVIGRSGRTGLAVGLYTAACVGIGVAATVAGLVMLATGQGYGPVYLPELHKNFIGGALIVAFVILYARPAWFRWPPRYAWPAMVALALGIAASGSRQAIVGGIAGLLVVALRRDPVTGRIRVAPWLLAAPALIVVMTQLNDQLDTGDQFNSAYQRLDWYAETVAIWQSSPVFGVGLRWWYTGRFGQFQPPNAELEVLSSTGVVGLVGFLAMFAIAVVALWRMDPAYGTAALAVVVSRFVQAQFDLYWVAGQASVLWIVAGIAYGAQARDRERAPLPVLPVSRMLPALPRA